MGYDSSAKQQLLVFYRMVGQVPCRTGNTLEVAATLRAGFA
jgi:hypothetical protein